MNEKEQDLMERYIYMVVRRLPKEQRAEIRLELIELIGEMQETEGLSMEEVLMKLGDPIEFAKKYRDDNNYVISPEYYENYVWILKVVLICVGISALISALVASLKEASGLVSFFSLWLAESITDLFVNGISAFGMVTLIFVILERQKVKVDLKLQKSWSVEQMKESMEEGKKSWSPSKLDPVPDKRAGIGRSESVISILFLVILGGIFIFAPQLVGAYTFEGGKLVNTIPLFNMEKWNLILPFLLAAFIAGLLENIIQLVTGYYCRAVLISNVILGGIQVILAVILLKLLPLWNPNFMIQVEEQFQFRATSKADLLHYWGTSQFSNFVLAIICVGFCIEIGVTIYKTMRYGRKIRMS